MSASNATPQGVVGLGLGKAAPAAPAPAPQGVVGLGLGKAAPAPAPAPAPQGVVGLGLGKAAPAPAPAPAPQGVVGLGLGAKPAPSAPAPAPQGVVGLGLGAKPAPSAPAPQGPVGLGLGAKPAPAAPENAPAEVKPRRPGIVIGDTAAERIRTLLTQRGTPTALLRIRVKGGGCSGLSYDMEWSDAPREKDRVFENGTVKLCVDPKSYIFLVGTTLEYFTTKLESGFKLVNPNVQKSCSCGESFTV